MNIKLKLFFQQGRQQTRNQEDKRGEEIGDLEQRLKDLLGELKELDEKENQVKARGSKS